MELTNFLDVSFYFFILFYFYFLSLWNILHWAGLLQTLIACIMRFKMNLMFVIPKLAHGRLHSHTWITDNEFKCWLIQKDITSGVKNAAFPSVLNFKQEENLCRVPELTEWLAVNGGCLIFNIKSDHCHINIFKTLPYISAEITLWLYHRGHAQRHTTVV